MAVRLFAELLLGVLIVVSVIAVLRKSAQALGGTPELDVSRTPSEWFTDSRTTDDGRTEVCVVRVETRSGIVRERRVLRTLVNDSPGYKDELDQAMDDAYETMRILNVNLRRR